MVAFVFLLVLLSRTTAITTKTMAPMVRYAPVERPQEADILIDVVPCGSVTVTVPEPCRLPNPTLLSWENP